MTVPAEAKPAMAFKGKWKIQRHCFRCGAVKPFFYCDNCGRYFCTAHHGNDPEFGPYHEDCL